MTRNIDMTQGSIKKNLIRFAIPLFLGNLFQQLYNAADSLIVGNYLGQQALASVSSSGPLIFMLIGFFNGVAMGAGVVISKCFGAKDEEGMHKAIHTDIAFGLAAGIILTIFSSIMTPTILTWMKTPDDIMANSISYFRIYSAGLIFTVMYNVCMGIMNAVGDSRHPLYYLILSSVINVVLDIVFIRFFHMGVGSAALATIISQGISVICCFYKLTRKDVIYKVTIKEIGFDRKMIKEIIRFGVPAGVQNSVIGFANTIVQTNINTFTSAAVAGSGAYAKIEGFAFLPITCFSLGLTTFIGQNLGAKQYDRAKQGARFGIFCSIIMAEIIGVIFFTFAPLLISLFNDSPEVIAFGTRQARIESLFFFGLALSHCIAGILRGAGRATVPMCIFFGVWCAFRVAYITIALRFYHHIEVIYTAYPITWMLSSIIFVIYLLSSDWIHGLEKKSRLFHH